MLAEREEFESWERQCRADRRPQITVKQVDTAAAKMRAAAACAP